MRKEKEIVGCVEVDLYPLRRSWNSAKPKLVLEPRTDMVHTSHCMYRTKTLKEVVFYNETKPTL